MESAHNENIQLTLVNLIDKCDASLLKARAITSCLLAIRTEEMTLCPKFWYGALWSIDDYLEELATLFNKIEKSAGNKNQLALH